jgi:acyl transferase domain-containing protein
VISKEARGAMTSAPDPAAGPVMPLHVWALSGRTRGALRQRGGRLAAWLDEHDDADLADVGWTLAVGREHLAHRAVLVGASKARLAAGLRALADGQPADGLTTGTVTEPGKTVFVFPGQGSQWAGMARDLLASSPVFREHVRACSAALKPYTGWSVTGLLSGAPGVPELAGDDVVQPALFAVMTGLARLWESLGVRPAAVLGHSQGEIAAAHAAGALTLADAARIVAVRSRAVSRLAGTGAMVSVALPASRAQQLIDRRRGGGELYVAAVNGPGGCVLSGTPDAVAALVARCTADGVRTRLVPVSYASHSPLVEPLREPLAAALAGVTPASGTVAFCSTVTGEVIDTAGLDAGYWYANLRSPIQFEPAVRVLAGSGHSVFIEVSPHPSLAVSVRETLTDAGQRAIVTGSLRRGAQAWPRLLSAFAELHAGGVEVSWPAVFEGRPRRLVALPGYPPRRRPLEV